MIYIYILIAVQLLNGLFFWKGYEKAGYKGWQAFVPFYNTVIFLRIIERPWWWVFLLYLPVIGNIMAIVMNYEWLHVPSKTLYPLIGCYPWAFYCLSDVPTKSSICRKRL